MAQSQKALAAASALVLGLFAVNWVAGVYLGYPVIYCAARPFTPLVAPLFYWLWLASTVMFFVYMFTTGISKLTLRAMAYGFLAQLIPAWTKTLFSLGLSC